MQATKQDAPAARYFTHWDWFWNITTTYHLTKETAKTVWGVPVDNPDDEPRRFSKHRIRIVSQQKGS